ncbi:MAG TPA: hypothetical protein VKU41_11355 [Polyangiaceae bacterium]|nr:hypothetical protein [Polyangiaceae bacterium]
MAQALVEFRSLSAVPRDDDSESFEPFERFVASHPHSGWNAALLTNLGLAYYHAGRFSKAFAAYERAWVDGRDASDWKARAVVDLAVGELAKMHARVGHADALEALFKDIGDRPVAGPATELVTGAHEGLWEMRNDPGLAFLCGPKALKNVLLTLGAAPKSVSFLDDERSGTHGYALGQVGELAGRVGLAHRLIHRVPGQLVPVPSVIHWKVNHYAAVTGHEGGRFHIQDPTFGGDLTVSGAVIDDEASGYFLVPDGAESDAAWRDVTPDEGKAVYGMGFTNTSPQGGSNDSSPRIDNCGGGGASGNSCPATPSDLSTPDVTGPSQCTPAGDAGGGGNIAMCVPSAYASTVSLLISDTPVGYSPQRGPSVFVRLTYNQREDSQPATFGFFNVSPKWTMNVLSYVQDDPNSAGNSVTRYLPGGGQFSYTGYSSGSGAFGAERQTGAVLSRSPTTGPATSCTLAITDGRQLVYASRDGATSYPRRVFLTSITDAQGTRSPRRTTGSTGSRGSPTRRGGRRRSRTRSQARAASTSSRPSATRSAAPRTSPTTRAAGSRRSPTCPGSRLPSDTTRAR